MIFIDRRRVHDVDDVDDFIDHVGFWVGALV
ncbi:MAG: hypothetical protein ACJAR2_001839 [Ilumatobacter sp.]